MTKKEVLYKEKQIVYEYCKHPLQLMIIYFLIFFAYTFLFFYNVGSTLLATIILLVIYVCITFLTLSTIIAHRYIFKIYHEFRSGNKETKTVFLKEIAPHSEENILNRYGHTIGNHKYNLITYDEEKYCLTLPGGGFFVMRGSGFINMSVNITYLKDTKLLLRIVPAKKHNQTRIQHARIKNIMSILKPYIY